MTIYNFRQFISNLITENLHPELQEVIRDPSYKSRAAGIRSNTPMQTKLAKKIRELSYRNEATGIEGNMPKGSSRAYMKHSTPEKITLDEKETPIHVGTKVAIRAALDKYHDHKEHGGSLGEMQNRIENADHFVNSHYRVLTQHSDGKYTTNEEHGIFPPLIDHDHKSNQFSTVGNAGKITKNKFKELTKTESHPNGISHSDFVEALERRHHTQNGRYWGENDDHEKHLDHIDTHPLVQKFRDYHDNTGISPGDYGQIRNMGVFKHPITGKESVVAVDHGWGVEAQKAYVSAAKKKYEWKNRI